MGIGFKAIDKANKPIENKIINDNTPFIELEAYKSARTNLMFILGRQNKENRENVVAFTSAKPGDGKTTTIINIAITFAQAGHKVLIIDADMRKPRIHRAFEVKAAPGLSDVLSGMQDRLSVYNGLRENLFILTAGTIPPNPSELLQSSIMDGVLNKVSKEFDYVFIDMPPVGTVTDAAILAHRIAGVVLVTRYKVTSEDELRDATRRITAVGGKIIGTVLNDVDQRTGPNRYTYRYKYHYSTYGYSDKTNKK